MKSAFSFADILLPNAEKLDNWAVIACDQFTSDRSYWDRVTSRTEKVPSAYHLVFPEIDLENDAEKRIEKINQTMIRYVADNIFTTYDRSFVYVERTLLDGSVRPGLIGAVDLEQYHYDPAYKPAIGATEQTILERVPPRIAVRRNAELELSHIILFCNDMENVLFDHILQIKSQLTKLYDFDLMEEGGHISGWLVQGENAEEIQRLVDAYLSAGDETRLLVADGNHSLVTAKCWYEELKQKNPQQDLSSHPARFAMVELENIQDPSIHFEPIHRVIFQTNPEKLLADMESICSEEGAEIEWIAGEKKGSFKLKLEDGQLPVSVFQNFLDRWLSENEGKIDYVHDTDAVESFAKESNTIGFLLPIFDKKELFAFGASGHILPRKTFSLGHGREKRYYLEGRLIR